jgi:cytochrome c oxidase subunit 3
MQFLPKVNVLDNGLILLILIIIFWSRDIIREATHLLQHFKTVQTGLKFGFGLFIVSEAFFFLGFFWAFFHAALAPSISIGAVWPPYFIEGLNAFEVPLWNTIILLNSGGMITLAHQLFIVQEKQAALYAFELTIILALFFTLFQLIEYFSAPFNLSDSVYGSTFYLATGFHGFHVIVGTIFILVAFIRYYFDHFSAKNQIGLEIAAWYWHFVDVIWLFLFLVVYFWGNSVTFFI